MERPWTAELFEWMKQARVDVPEEGLAQAQEEADSADPGGGVDVVSPEVDTTVTGVMETEVTVTGALVVVKGVLVVVDTEVEDIPLVATEITGVRVDMVNALDLTEMDMTAMLHTSKHLPDSRSSLGWLYMKDAHLKKNVHVLLLILVCSSLVVARCLKCSHEFWSINPVARFS